MKIGFGKFYAMQVLVVFAALATSAFAHSASATISPQEIAQLTAACKSHGYDEGTCKGMVAAYLNGNGYSGPNAFVPPNSSRRSVFFRKCMTWGSTGVQSGWTAKTMYEMRSGLCQRLDLENAKGIPDFDSDAYCHEIGDAAGGSNEIELVCRRQEDLAHKWVDDHSTSPRTMKYCSQVAGGAATGSAGSYQLLQTCIQQEEQAGMELDDQ